MQNTGKCTGHNAFLRCVEVPVTMNGTAVHQHMCTSLELMGPKSILRALEHGILNPCNINSGVFYPPGMPSFCLQLPIDVNDCVLLSLGMHRHRCKYLYSIWVYFKNMLYECLCMCQHNPEYSSIQPLMIPWVGEISQNLDCMSLGHSCPI